MLSDLRIHRWCKTSFHHLTELPLAMQGVRLMAYVSIALDMGSPDSQHACMHAEHRYRRVGHLSQTC